MRSLGSSSARSRRLFSPAGTLAVFAVIRVMTVAVASLFRPAGSPLLPLKGDIAWYTSIAEFGYDHPAWNAAGNLEPSNLAFFPLTTWLSQPLQWIGVSANWSLAIVSAVASGFAAWAIYRIGEHLRGPRIGFFLAVAWGCLMPASIALSLPLSESVYTALVAWALLAMLRQQALTAGVLTAVAGLTRPTALALLVPLVWLAVNKIRERDHPGRAVASVLIGPLGFIGFVVFVGARVERPTGYFAVQRTYGSEVDWGVSWFGTLWKFVSEGPGRLTNWITVATVIAILISLIILLWIKPPATLVLFVATSLILIVIQSDHLGAVQRFTVPLFPLLLPAAIGLSRLRLRYSAVIIIAATLATSWYGAQLLYVAKANIV